MIKYKILIPSFNDWECLNILIPKIDDSLNNITESVDLIIINDCSTTKNTMFFKNLINLKEIKIINLKQYVKAQIAITSGLAFLKKEKFQGGIIVMDADGQDSPEQLIDIIKESKKKPERTITINRKSREDEFIFKTLYQIYLYLTFILTFKHMKFGVYSYIHSSNLNKILSTNDVCMAYAASLAKHFKDKHTIFAPRKKRLFGESKNNYLSLVHYALKIISVFRYKSLINSVLVVLLSFFLINFNFFVFILFFSLFFNILIFLVSASVKKINIENILLNIKNIQNLKFNSK
jgi:hypothetical protein